MTSKKVFFVANGHGGIGMWTVQAAYPRDAVVAFSKAVHKEQWLSFLHDGLVNVYPAKNICDVLEPDYGNKILENQNVCDYFCSRKSQEGKEKV